MRRLFENKLIVFLIAVTVLLAAVIGILSSCGSDASVIENISGETMTPPQNAVSSAGGFFGKIFGYFGNVKALKEEAELLKSENTTLKKHIKDMESIEKENKELRSMLKLKKKQTNIDLLAASVASKDPSNWYSTFTINKGESDGVAQNQAVVNANRELVGQIYKVGNDWAEVITILDSQSSLGAMIRRSDEIGILEGDASLRFSGMCRLGYIARDSDIQSGDYVETSGLGGIFPKGLLIGTIEEVYEENATMSKAAKVKPLADIRKLDEVFVITGYDEVDLSDDFDGTADDDDESDNDDNDDNDDDDNDDNDDNADGDDSSDNGESDEE